MRLRSAKWIIVIAFFGVISGITAGSVLILIRDLPQITALENFQPSAVTRVYSADNELLAELYAQRRDPVSFSQIPTLLISALLTTEDRQFYEHSGIAVKGILRAVLKNLIKGRYAEGASTITQQLAKTLFLTPRKAITRKLREAILSFQLEQRYTKNEILTLYLNQVYFGNGAYGVEAASHTFFLQSVEKLSIAQCAMLVGSLKAPSRYSPIDNPELAIQRRNIVLSLMHDTGVIDTAAYNGARQEPLPTIKRPVFNETAPFFIDYIKQELEGIVGTDMIYKGGLSILTTLSTQNQTAAERALISGINAVCDRRSQTGIDSCDTQAALVAIDIETGGIISMVGGVDYAQSKLNRSVNAARQPGSAFKPILYALAIELGYDQNQTLLDAPVIFSQSDQKDDWQPDNFSQTYAGEVSLRWALAHSKNIPAIRLIEKVGPTSLVHFAHSMGFDNTLRPTLSLALGTSEVNLLTLTAAYGVFANHGTYTRPFGVSQIRNKNGELLWTVKPERHIALPSSTAAIMTDMLTEVVQSGTGQAAKVLHGAVAGKTGTTDQYKDALFVGYSPKTVAGVWVGNDDATSMGEGETGAKAALPIWISYMKTAIGIRQPSYFDFPDDVEQISIDLKTGRRMPGDSPKAIKVLIKKDSGVRATPK